MNLENLPIHLKETQARLRSVMLRLPLLVGNEALNFVLDNFKKQGFLGASFQPWRKRRDPNKWGQSDKRSGRALLIDSGRLRRSWRVVQMSLDRVSIGTDVPYAKAHNDGFRGTVKQDVKAFTRKKNYKDETSAPGARKQLFTKTHTGNVNVSAFTRTIRQNTPVRKMVGESPYLTARVRRVVNVEVMKEFR